jgi:hypothetical protein
MKSILKNMSRILLIVAAVLIVGGIVMLALLVPSAASTFYMICLAAISILCILMGVGLLFCLFLGRDNDPNFFLYDPKTARNIPASELDFERINSRMGYFMTTLSTSLEKLWSDNALDSKPEKFGVNEVYKPLAAYKMIYDLAEIDSPEGWRLFLNASPAAITTLTDALLQNGEDAMVKTLIKAYNTASSIDDYEWLSDFLKGNKPYISRRMTAYVRKNMEWFY